MMPQTGMILKKLSRSSTHNFSLKQILKGVGVYSVISEGSELTTEGQYPNSSRNSSGFRTTDSDHILPAASVSPSSSSSSSSTSSKTGGKNKIIPRKFFSRALAPPRPLRADSIFQGGEGAHPSTRPRRYARHVCSQRGETSSLRGGKKFVGIHAEKFRAAFTLR